MFEVKRRNVILVHVRRLKNQEDFRSCATSVGSKECMLLKQVVDTTRRKQRASQHVASSGSLAKEDAQEEGPTLKRSE